MSLVNQVLNDLEKRGVNVTQADASIRAVPPRKTSNHVPYVLAMLVLLIMAAAAKWYWGSREAIVVAPVVVADAPQFALVPGLDPAASASIPEPASAVTATPPVAEAVVETPKVEAGKKKTRRSVAPDLADSSQMPDDRSDTASTSVPIKVISPRQRAENEFSKANMAAQAGRMDEALAGYESALLSDPTHKPSRRAWVSLLLTMKRNDEAERVLQRGMKRDPHDASFAMLLARLQVERGAVPLALETLQKNLPDAADQADYQAFMAALLQRQDRHQEAVAFFQKALALVPGNGVWLMGMGISLQTTQRNEEARVAYQSALASNTLSPQLQEFVRQKLKGL